jgi:thioredoxin-like negative regulator of GroEL
MTEVQQVRAWVQQLGNPESTLRQAAADQLLALDEDGIDLMVAEYYANLPERIAVELLRIIGEIGGWEALSLLGEVYYSRETRPLVKAAARMALLQNAESLDPLQVQRLQDDTAG